MNPKERLRAYLEQRRELGESEMMLDALDVDDVMRMLGALPGSAAAGAAPVATGSEDELPAALRLQKTDGVPPAPMPPMSAPPRAGVPDPQERVVFNAGAPDAPPASGDWREVMRNLQGGSQGGSAAKPPAVPPPAPMAPPVPPGDAPRDESVQAVPHREPLIGTLRVEGLVVPLGLRIERPALQSAAAALGLSTLA